MQGVALVRDLADELRLRDVDLRELGDFLVQRVDGVANLREDVRDLLRGVRAVLRQLPNLVGDDGEAAPLLARARRLDGGVEPEHVRLRRDGLDEVDDFVRLDDLRRRLVHGALMLERLVHGDGADDLAASSSGMLTAT